MRAYRGDELGKLENFALRQVEDPQPGRGEMLVAVEATALGFVDQLVMRALYQVRPPNPFVPGGEIVGRIERLGEGVTGFERGQRVASWQYGGGLADKALLKPEHAVGVPDGMEATTAAALLLDYLTAYHGLFDRGALQPGETVLVTGASGGVGSAAVQLAAACAARVVALASTGEKRALAESLGAALTIDYRLQDWRATLKRRIPEGIDMVFDPVGGSLFELCFRSLAKGGRHLVVGFASGEGIASLPANLPLLKSGELIGVDARHLWQSDPGRVRQILSRILRMAASGRIKPVVARIFGLEAADEAVRFVTSKERLGKVVVTP